MNGKIALDDYTPLFARVEHTFEASFATVNAAVYHMITLYSGQHDLSSIRDDTAGATRYCIGLRSQKDTDFAYVFVLSRGEALTTISVHPLVRRGHAHLWQIEALDLLQTMLAYCCAEVVRAVQYAQPDFGQRPIEITPPMPRWDDDPEAVFSWKGRYARSMSDQELAEKAGVSLQRLYNKKSELGLARTPRGKSNKKDGKNR